MKIIQSNVTLMVKNLDKALDFYLALGLTLKNRWGDHYAMVEAPGVIIGLHPSDGETGMDSASIGFMIDDLKEAQELLTKLSVKFEAANGKSGAYLHFADRDGNRLYFTKPA